MTSETKRKPHPSPKTFERKAVAMPMLKPARPAAEALPAAEAAKAEAEQSGAAATPAGVAAQRAVLLRVVEAVKAL
jgi:hypothetical protein